MGREFTPLSAIQWNTVTKLEESSTEASSVIDSVLDICSQLEFQDKANWKTR